MVEEVFAPHAAYPALPARVHYHGGLRRCDGRYDAAEILTGQPAADLRKAPRKGDEALDAGAWWQARPRSAGRVYS